MNIVITGGAGFVGTNLAKMLLADGHKVMVLDDYSVGKVENQIEKIQSNSMQFDELLELYPKKTPKGRALQAGYRLNREKFRNLQG